MGIVDVEDVQCFSLPASVEELNRTLNVVEKESIVPTFDFMWTDPADDARDRRFTRMALVAEENEVPLRQIYPHDQMYLADATLKVQFWFIYHRTITPLKSYLDGPGHSKGDVRC